MPADAGYQDVRRTTAARLESDVRWYRHESAAATGETRKILARPLNADSAVQLALLNNQGLQAAFEELGVARARLVQALRLPNPTVDAAVRFGGPSRPAVDVDAMLDISELAFLPLRNGPAGAEMDAAKASVAGRVLDLAFQVRVSFYEYQAAQQTFELRGTILEALGASLEAAQRLHEAGNITDLTFANEQALHEEARVAHTRTEADLMARREALSSILGLWGQRAGWIAEPRLVDEVSFDHTVAGLEARAIERSLDLELLRLRFTAAAKGANLATVRGWVPELRAGVSAEREEGAWAVGPAITLEVPLFYQGQGEAEAAAADARRQQKLYADTAARIRSAARAVASRLQATALSAQHYKRVLLPLREQILNDTQLEYNAMSVGVFQLLQAKRDQIETARAYVELLRDYWVLRAEADQLIAGRLPRREASTDTMGDDPMGPGAGTGTTAH